MENYPSKNALQHSSLKKRRSVTSVNFTLKPASDSQLNTFSVSHQNGLNCSTVSLGKHSGHASVQISIDSSARTISASCVSFPVQRELVQRTRNSVSVPSSPCVERQGPVLFRPYADRLLIPTRFKMYQQNGLVPKEEFLVDVADLQGLLMSQMDRCSELRRQLEYERFRLNQLRQDVAFLENTLYQRRRRLEYNFGLSRHCPERLRVLRDENEKLKMLCDRLLKEMDRGHQAVSVT